MKKNIFLNFKKKIIYGFSSLALLTLCLVLTSFDKSFDDNESNIVILTDVDTDRDGIRDENDIDDDNDGILDIIEDGNKDADGKPETNSTDMDGDGIPNYLDIDSDNDGILDNVEAQSSSEYVAPSGIDQNKNGLDDIYETNFDLGINPINTDEDNGGNGFLPDYLDIDSDIDGIRDNIEAQSYSGFVAPSGIDQNKNGLDDSYEGTYGFGITPVKSDNDPFPDFRDFDSDNDGIKDKVEAQTSEGIIYPIGDNNNNDIDDAYENGLVPIDTESDGVPDYKDLDSDGDGILDNIESQDLFHYKPPSGNDLDENGMDDVYGTSGIDPINSDSDIQPNFRDIDSDNDGLPDNIEAQPTVGYIPPNNDSKMTYEANQGVNSAYLSGLVPENTDGTDEFPDYLDSDADNDLVHDSNEGNDFNFDGIPDQVYTNSDTDGDGLDDGYEGSNTADGYDVNDEIESPVNDLPDKDGTEDVNYRDLDDDGDGLDTPNEDADGNDDPTNDDTDGDNTPDYLDPLGEHGDSDGDGVINDEEEEDGTDPNDSCDFVLASQTVNPSYEWKALDCDGDGVTNGNELEDCTDPLDPCDYKPDSVTLPQSGDYLTADCDGDGVTNGNEIEDETDPNDSCDFVLSSQTVEPFTEWKRLDCDGDGVKNRDEIKDRTDPLDPCDYNPDSVTLPQSGDYLTADCDGDGVTNGDEEEDGTDPNDGCDFVLSSQSVDPSSEWNALDCDGDGVTNGDELEDGTDPLDPCDYNPESVTLTPTADWEELDCDDDGNPNGTDPDPQVATARDDSGSTPALTEVAINILENDDYLPNNDTNNLGITNLSRIDGTASGTVAFDAETGIMTYTPTSEESNSTVTIVYQVCNVLPEPNVCASATVFIEIGLNTIDAQDDIFNSDTYPDGNVLSNDTLNGEPVTLSDVILTSTPTDELTINEDGSIRVVPGTEDGTYIIEYTICERANPENCDTAIVTVEIDSGMGNVIDAQDDSYSTNTSGAEIPGSNVLSNDTLNGESVTLSNVILTSIPTDALMINVDGSVSVISGTEDGTYTIEYTICEIADVDNCDMATVTVVVDSSMGNVIDAQDDTFNSDTYPDGNVLSNDTLNGEPVTLSDVILTSTPTDVLTINGDGSISVAGGTEDGTYTIEYTICEIADVDNCDTAIVTVEIDSGLVNALNAQDDTYSSDTTGGLIAGSDVLSNDTLNGESITLSDVILTSTPTNILTVNEEDGSVSVVPGTEDGTYTIEYTICEIGDVDNCDTATVTVVIENILVNQLLTPNGDLKNDFLFIRGVSKIRTSTIKIYNRWGVAVYEGQDYDNIRNVFDGRSRGRSTLSVNEYLPAGVYFYIFNYETDKGSFTDSDYIYISR